MPLSNLLVVFCLSLGMTPPLLKTLCEVGGIWGEGSGLVGEVIDIRRREVEMADTEEAESEDARSSSWLGDEDSVASASSRQSLDNPSEDYHGSAEGSIVRGAVLRVLRADFTREVLTVYLLWICGGRLGVSDWRLVCRVFRCSPHAFRRFPLRQSRHGRQGVPHKFFGQGSLTCRNASPRRVDCISRCVSNC